MYEVLQKTEKKTSKNELSNPDLIRCLRADFLSPEQNQIPNKFHIYFLKTEIKLHLNSYMGKHYQIRFLIRLIRVNEM